MQHRLLRAGALREAGCPLSVQQLVTRRGLPYMQVRRDLARLQREHQAVRPSPRLWESAYREAPAAARPAADQSHEARVAGIWDRVARRAEELRAQARAMTRGA